MMTGVRRSLLAVVVLLAAVAGGVAVASGAPDPRPRLLAALDALPADTETANVTDWGHVRDELEIASAGGSETLRRVLAQGFSTDLVEASPLAEAAPVMAADYGWSVVEADWEAFGQSPQGAVAVVSLGSVDPSAVVAGLDNLGYAPPSSGADSGGVWKGGPDLLASVDPALSPLLGYVAVLADDGLALFSDDPGYLARAASAAGGDAESMAADPDVAALGLRLADDPVAVVHTRERGCAVTSLRTASPEDRVAARRLVASGGPLAVYDVLGLGLRLTDDGSTLDVAMRFAEPAVATAQEPVRLALAHGEALAQGGSWEERFDGVDTETDGTDLVLELTSDDREARLLSDLGTGGLLFASCP